MTHEPMISRLAIEGWLCRHLATIGGVSPNQINTFASFDELGVDSAAGINVIGEMEEWLEIELDLTLPYNFPTIDSLAREVARLKSHAE